MKRFKEIKLEANKLRKEKQYKEALPLYRECWEEYKDHCNEWDIWGYAFCLNKLGEYTEALELCRELYKKNPDFDANRNLYAWAIYYTEIKKDKIHDKDTFEKAAKGILQLSSQEDQYSPYTATVFRVLGAFKEPFNALKIKEWCQYLNSDLLDQEVFKFTDERGKEMELASKKEDYFALLSQALFENGEYQDCIEICNKGLNQIDKHHYSNDIWFKRRIALCYKQIGEDEMALNILLQLLKRKKEWFIQKEIAECHLKLGNNEDALTYAIEGALGHGDIDKKTNLYFLIGELYEAQGESRNANTHFEFVKCIKEENDQKVPDKVLQKIDSTNSQSDEKKAKDYFRICRSIWNGQKFKGEELHQGTISKMLPHGKAGFVKSDTDGQGYYFRSGSFKGRRDLMKEDITVKFYLQDSYDKAKDKKTKEAVNVTPIRK